MHIVEQKVCRLCGGSEIPIVFDWGLSPLANAFKSKENLSKPEFEAPLGYFQCQDCYSVQLKHEVDSEILFNDYLYESPPNLIPHFKNTVEMTLGLLGPIKRVLDIGSNNGLLLNEYKECKEWDCKVMGFEPATKIAEKAVSKGIPTINDYFNPLSAENFALRYKEADLVVSTNCFAHVSDLNEFIEGIKIVLNKNGYFVFENAYLLNTLINKDLGQCYFEHYYMHHLTPLVKLFDKHGLELFFIEYITVQMGSIRGYVRWKGNNKVKVGNEVKNALDLENLVGLQNLETFKNFNEEIKGLKNSLRNKIGEIIALFEGRVCVYGWPAKMTLINKVFGLDPYLSYIVEESPTKIGKFAPGTELEVKDLNYFKENSTDYCLLGAYNFEKDIKEKNQWYKGRWINPLKY